MACVDASCHCQSEVSIEREGKEYCSERCASARPGVPDACACGHVGCSGSEEQVFAEGEPALGEDARRPR
jgi:Prokaryotic metallothionein